MAPEIKAIVFKTPLLKATKLFFENIGFQIKETSLMHFVIYSKNLRLVFLKSERDFEIELYTNEKESSEKCLSEKCDEHSFETSEDPNGIKMVRIFNHQKKKITQSKN
ncbi:hypothetical protein J2Y38_002255 [Flavobacterium sp. 2755]|uniref:hypothetical protein n=1 Tax=Flavobacterium sp. 2755 TaxID=2817765 RepID=UPI002862C76C|nr:hypothetical protein [Flavobacterium sp. 2755]MDR6762044.1 hypothetical protein [Flavobacterium sp. 2755]